MKLLIILLLLLSSIELHASKAVIILHGLGRSASSMETIEKRFKEHKFKTFNIDYESKNEMKFIADSILYNKMKRIEDNHDTLFAVTHSMGGILVRYLAEKKNIKFHKVAMLSPPNKGSEVSDYLRSKAWAMYIMGPALAQLSTDTLSIPNNLGKPNFDFIVITGDRTINFINSFIIPGPDDGKVSLESAKLEGMSEYHVVHKTHTFIMNSEEVFEIVLKFFRE